MTKGKIKEIFPGGNTSQGFFSYYDYILGQQEATRIIILKGGPGVGKSTFMKKIALEMVDRGYDVEFMHCSSDNNSLDGVVIPAIKVALLDGTAPHVVDPKNPGAVDEIIHLGDFWNEEGVRANREYILRDNREVGRIFGRAYRYLRAAASVYEDSAVIYGWAIDNAKVNIEADRLTKELFGDTALSLKEGKQRHLFASAITPDGLKNYLGTILTVGKVYVLRGNPGTGTEKLLEKVRTAAAERGYYVESYYCALHPKKLEHLLIPEIDAAFTTANQYHTVDIEPYDEVDLNDYLDSEILETYKEELEYNHDRFDELLGITMETIHNAKAIHDRMESYYIPNMDFEAVQRCWESTMARVLEYAGEFK